MCSNPTASAAFEVEDLILFPPLRYRRLDLLYPRTPHYHSQHQYPPNPHLPGHLHDHLYPLRSLQTLHLRNLRARAKGFEPVGARLVHCEWGGSAHEVLRAFKKIESEETPFLLEGVHNGNIVNATLNFQNAIISKTAASPKP